MKLIKSENVMVVGGGTVRIKKKCLQVSTGAREV